MESTIDLTHSSKFFKLYAIVSAGMLVDHLVRRFFEDLSFEDKLRGLFHGAVILGICPLIFLCLYGLKRGIDRLQGAYRIDQLKKFKIECVICFGLLALGGIVPRILVLLEPPGLYMKYFLFAIYPFSSICLIYLFLNDLGTRYNVYTHHRSPMKLLAFFYPLHYFSAAYTSELHSFIYNGAENKEISSFINVIFINCAMVSSFELVLVLIGNFRDASEPESVPVQKKIRKRPPVAKPVENDPRIECKICLLEYNDNTRTPRILKECGHTVCQECAQILLNKFNNMHLFCPYCQQMSVIKGPATLLAKNFLVTDFMWKLKNNTN